jgi:hypothetical protein
MKPKRCFKGHFTVYVEAFSFIVKHTLFALEECVLHRMTYVYES